jgi:hypothetical protein
MRRRHQCNSNDKTGCIASTCRWPRDADNENTRTFDVKAGAQYGVASPRTSCGDNELRKTRRTCTNYTLVLRPHERICTLKCDVSHCLARLRGFIMLRQASIGACQMRVGLKDLYRSFFLNFVVMWQSQVVERTRRGGPRHTYYGSCMFSHDSWGIQSSNCCLLPLFASRCRRPVTTLVVQ